VFAVEVRDHIMVAHSLRGAVFGPAQSLHGATFIVDAAVFADTLDANGVVVDIGRAQAVLKEVLAELNFRNLDEVAEFKGVNSTTEFLAHQIFEKIAAKARAGALGRNGKELARVRVTISESHVARAWYEAALW
jgi:6-pyruvoyl-tetrahydropterin synthase